ncbi:MFS transporter [Streptomyces triticiradicis]|uniref:MFS transporter n=1 Tax=Streptomyces triticiradicis TaxID=2651189 RepID=A0A7J5D7A9_9ACTN|nr:MFS transporter [Streptomyces triticiradicis]KAB1979051.1 MFS transporter [Streptomyces triticiradicis]
MSAAVSDAAPSPPPALANSPRRWWALAALTLCVLIIGLDGTIINVALPSMAQELGADSADLQWISGGYLLALSAAMLPVGMLGDRFGHKKLLVAGIALFGLASGAGALVDSTGAVITVRAVLGLAAAIITPLSMAILPKIFAQEELQKAIATWTGATALGLPIGPLVGGWLLNHFWWGSVFVFNIPVVVAALIAGVWLLPNDSRRHEAEAARAAGRAPAAEEKQGSFDLLGTVLSATGITALVYGTILQPTKGWSDVQVTGSLIAGVVLLVGFVLYQRRIPHPLVNLKLFSDHRFGWGALIAVFVQFAVVGILFVLPQYLQGVLGADAFGTGLRLLPMIGGLMGAAALSDGLVSKLGSRTIIPIGLLLLAVGGLLGSFTRNGDGYGSVALWLTLTGLGFGLAIVPATTLVMSSLPPERSGAGTSLLETLQQVGGVLGVAVLGSLLSSRYLDQLSTDHLSAPAAHAARDSVLGADAVASQLHDKALLTSAHSAFVHGMSLVLVVCAVSSLLAAVLAVVFLPARSQDPTLLKAKEAEAKKAEETRKAEEAANGTAGAVEDDTTTTQHGESLV